MGADAQNELRATFSRCEWYLLSAVYGPPPHAVYLSRGAEHRVGLPGVVGTCVEHPYLPAARTLVKLGLLRFQVQPEWVGLFGTREGARAHYLASVGEPGTASKEGGS